MVENGFSNTKWRRQIIAYAPLFIWITVIFFLSSPQGSMEETSRILGPILTFLFPSIDEATIQTYHGYIRKAAHVTEYAVLSFIAIRAFGRSLAPRLRKWHFASALLLVTVVASLDEFNQSFEVSRTSSYSDVLLDVTGGGAIIVLFWVIRKLRPDLFGVSWR